MRLIDADELREEVLHDNEYDCDTVNYYLGRIDDTPTIDATPVVRGAWEKSNHGNGYMWCSRCHGFALEIQEFEELSNYCPNCGANMKGDENDG